MASARSTGDGRTRASQKLLDGIGDVAGVVTEKWKVVVPRELEIAGPWNMLGEKPATLDADDLVAGPVDDECRDPDRRNDVADVNHLVHARIRGRTGRAKKRRP